MTETERRALKEHINILDCVQREWREVRPSSPHVSTRVRKCVDVARGCEQSECVWRRGERVRVCANAYGLVPVTLVSLIFSRWDTVSGCNTCAHARVHTDTHAERVWIT